MNPTTLSSDEVKARRKAARRTALWVGLIAVLIYGGFIVAGALR